MTEMEIFDSLPKQVRDFMNRGTRFKWDARSADAAIAQVGPDETLRQLAALDMRRAQEFPPMAGLRK